MDGNAASNRGQTAKAVPGGKFLVLACEAVVRSRHPHAPALNNRSIFGSGSGQSIVVGRERDRGVCPGPEDGTRAVPVVKPGVFSAGGRPRSVATTTGDHGQGGWSEVDDHETAWCSSAGALSERLPN